MSLYNMPPPGAPQPSSSLSGESPLALAPTVGDLSPADHLFGSGTTNGSGNGSADGHGHGHGPGHGGGSGNGNVNGNSNSNGTSTPSAHDQASQSAAAGPAVPAACLACVSKPFFFSSPEPFYSICTRILFLLPAGSPSSPRWAKLLALLESD